MFTAANDMIPNRMPPTAVRKDSSTVDSKMCRAASFWITEQFLSLLFPRSVYPFFNVLRAFLECLNWPYPTSDNTPFFWKVMPTSLRKSASTLWLLSMTRMTSQPAVVWVMGVCPLIAPAMNEASRVLVEHYDGHSAVNWSNIKNAAHYISIILRQTQRLRCL